MSNSGYLWRPDAELKARVKALSETSGISMNNILNSAAKAYVEATDPDGVTTDLSNAFTTMRTSYTSAVTTSSLAGMPMVTSESMPEDLMLVISNLGGEAPEDVTSGEDDEQEDEEGGD